MAELRLYFLGPPRVELDGAPVDLQRRKTLALLVYLAVSGKPHTRDALAALFYPELDQQRARAYLRRDLAVLNTSLARGPDGNAAGWLAADRDLVELRRSSSLWLDVDRFRHLAAAGRSHPHSPDTGCAACIPLLTEAADLYAGAFLAGFSLADSAEFDDWQFFQAESLRLELGALLQRLVTGLAEEGSCAAALPHARRWVSLDPLHEIAQRHLIRLYGLEGQTAAALRQYEEFVGVLAEELGAAPEAETTALYEAVKAQRRLGSSRSAAAPTQPSPQAVSSVNSGSGFAGGVRPAGKPPLIRHNLPLQATPFVGREKDLAAVGLLLADTTFRLLTLVGPGGIGKTRLALEIARRCLEPTREPPTEFPGEAAGFAGGVFFVDLAAVGAPRGHAVPVPAGDQASDLVLTAIAAALDFSFQGTADAKTQLLAYLRSQQMLLVLDNFESVVAAAGLLADLLAAAQGIRLLVTSRERLNLPEERVWELGGLAYPQEGWTLMVGDAMDDTTASPIAGLLYYDAIAFFSLQAQRVRSDFRLSPATAPHVLRLCRLVEGTPLALELAAGWLRVLSCAEIVAEIERSLDFLAAATRSSSPRHRSLRAVFEQSWQMLSAPEQEVFGRLSLFQGGFQRAAAEAVAGATLPILVGLVDKSLLRLAPAGRYHVHELVRQFAAEMLAENLAGQQTDSTVAARARYSTYFLQLLAARAPDLKGSTLPGTLATLRADLDNIRQAWQWAVAACQVEQIAAALNGLARLYDLTSLFAEGASVFGHAATDLAACAGDSSALVGRLWVEQARLLNRRGLAEQGAQLMPQVVALAQATADVGLEALACYQWGDALVFLGRAGQAQAMLERALGLARAAGLPMIEAETLRHLGNCRAYQGDAAGAVLAYYAALACFRRLQEWRGEGEVFNNLASFQQRRGLWGEAAANYELALRIFGELGYRWGQEAVLNNLGTLHHDLGHYDEAQAFCLQGLEVATEIRNLWGAGHVLDTLGTIMRSLGDFTAAQSYYWRALQLWRTFVSPYYESDTLAELALIWHLLGDDEAAYEYSRQAELIGRAVDSPRIRATALTHLGHAQLALGQLGEATESYQQALALCRNLDQAHSSREILAGLARVALAAGDLTQAQSFVAKLLPELTDDHLFGTREPLRVYLTCYQVLNAGQDPRAPEILAAAHQLLQARADAITDARLQRCFLANIPAHRAIGAAITAAAPGAR